VTGVAAGRRARLALVYGIAALVFTSDQLTKWLVVNHLAGHPPVRLLGSFVELRYATNSGGAFSVLTGAPAFFALMAILVVGAIVWSAMRPHGAAMLTCLGLLLGGALGNLADRLLRGGSPLRGEVVDFIAVWRWPVFNVADSCISVGVVLLAVLLTRAEREEPGEEPGEGGDTDRAASPRPTGPR
jgi:signal peptidase II